MLFIHMYVSIYGAMLYPQGWDSTWICFNECYTLRSLSSHGLTKCSLGNTYYFSLNACFESSFAFSSHL